MEENRPEPEPAAKQKLLDDLPPWALEEINRMLLVHREANDKDMTLEKAQKALDELRQKEADQALDERIKQMSTSQFSSYFNAQFQHHQDRPEEPARV